MLEIEGAGERLVRIAERVDLRERPLCTSRACCASLSRAPISSSAETRFEMSRMKPWTSSGVPSSARMTCAVEVTQTQCPSAWRTR